MLIGLLAPLAAAEIVLRFLPVNAGLQTRTVNDRNPVMRFAENRPFTYSVGWNFTLVNRGRTNNFGFVNDDDYDAGSRTPLLAVVGDSYVEALMVPYSETLHGRLAACAKPRGRVYSFGVSGAPLSQYLVEADFARSTFHPNAMVVVIVGNDFDESLLQYKSEPGMQYFQPGTNGLFLTRVDYVPSTARRVLRRSAVVRYLFHNLNVVGPWQRFRAAQYLGNTLATVDSARVANSRAAVDQFLRELPVRSAVEPARIVLLVDGIRPNLYTSEGLSAAEGSYVDLMRRYFVAKATEDGFEVLDLQPRFIERYRRDGVRFEFSTDQHWNGTGHEEAAAAVASSGVFSRLFGDLECAQTSRRSRWLSRAAERVHLRPPRGLRASVDAVEHAVTVAVGGAATRVDQRAQR